MTRGVVRRAVLLFALVLLSMDLVAQPRIAVRDTAFDFGTVSPGSKVVRRSVVSNTGSSDLLIHDVTATCGCSKPTIAQRILPPGSSAELTVIFDSKNFFGPIDKGILIVSNDTARRNYWVPVRAFVAQILQPEPQVIVFDDSGRGGVHERTVVLRNVSRSTVRLRRVSSPIREISARLSRTSLAPGDTATLTVRLTGSLSTRAAGQIVIETNRREQPKVRISCFVKSAR